MEGPRSNRDPKVVTAGGHRQYRARPRVRRGESMWKDRFGFLPRGIRFEFDGGSVVPLPNFKELQASVEERANPDGFAYPRQVVSVRQDAAPSASDDPNPWEEIPGTDRPGFLHRLPSSHQIVLDRQDANADCRAADGAFVVHLVPKQACFETT